MEPPVSEPRAKTASPAATAAALPPEDPARNSGEINGILGFLKIRGFGGGAHGKFVHIQLAGHDDVAGFQLVHHSSVIRRNKIRKHFGGTGGQNVFGADVVFDTDRDTGKVGHLCILGPLFIHFSGFSQSCFFVECNIGVDLFLCLLYPLKDGGSQLG